MTTTRTETLTVRLPEEVVRTLDSLIARGLFSSRSEAIREFLRDYVGEYGGS
jgi:Arc/MetJ-type ribon-helix-helix transcriptional regulator